MAKYAVTFIVTEVVTFELDATSEQDAENRAVADGEETYSEVLSTIVDEVEEV